MKMLENRCSVPNKMESPAQPHWGQSLGAERRSCKQKVAGSIPACGSVLRSNLDPDKTRITKKFRSGLKLQSRTRQSPDPTKSRSGFGGGSYRHFEILSRISKLIDRQIDANFFGIQPFLEEKKNKIGKHGPRQLRCFFFLMSHQRSVCLAQVPFSLTSAFTLFWECFSLLRILCFSFFLEKFHK